MFKELRYKELENKSFYNNLYMLIYFGEILPFYWDKQVIFSLDADNCSFCNYQKFRGN